MLFPTDFELLGTDRTFFFGISLYARIVLFEQLHHPMLLLIQIVVILVRCYHIL